MVPTDRLTSYQVPANETWQHTGMNHAKILAVSNNCQNPTNDRRMAGYQSATGKELKILQKRLQYFEVANAPVSPTRNIVGGRSSAVVFKFECKEKIVAYKKFKQCVSMKSLLKATDSLLKLEHNNVVRFSGYSARPVALIFKYCSVTLEGKMLQVVNKRCQ